MSELIVNIESSHACEAPVTPPFVQVLSTYQWPCTCGKCELLFHVCVCKLEKVFYARLLEWAEHYNDYCETSIMAITGDKP